MTDWYDIYKERMNDRYSRHINKKYKPLIDKILSIDATQFVELGCGAGNITKAVRELHQYRNSHTLIDLCPRMLGLAIENNPVENCKFICSDITTGTEQLLGNFEFNRVVHSHGVLEHFETQDIVKICEQADRYAGKQVHYVPSVKYGTPSRGDERLMSVEQWEEIMSSVRYDNRGMNTSIYTFNDGYDILIELTREFK